MGKLDPTLLRTFVEVARQGDETAAAAHMSLSGRDVSRRIKALELHLGYPLFDRRGDALCLTPKAQLLFEHLNEAFAAAERTGAKTAKTVERQRLIVSTLGPFAKGWLGPRLEAFARRHPELALRVDIDSRLIDFDQERVDLAIRHGLGDYPGLKSVRLFARDMVVVASPDLLSRGPALQDPADCVAYHLLRVEERPYWKLWFEALGLQGRGFRKVAAEGPSFARDRDMLDAAKNGKGLALVDKEVAAADLEAGHLVIALEAALPEDFAYYLVGRPETFKTKPAGAFREWIVKEARG